MQLQHGYFYFLFLQNKQKYLAIEQKTEEVVA